MPPKFASISFDDIIKRLLKSPYNAPCFQNLADQYYPSHDAKLKTNDYRKANKQQKTNLLQEIGEKCASLPKYKDYRREDVILMAIYDVVPTKWFKTIFGHVEKEEQLYPNVKRFLKRNFSDYKVIETYDMRSRVGIRWPDFTLVKKRTLRGYQLISFDVKTRLGAFDYFLNQAHDFSRFSDYTSLICTAGLVLELSKKERKSPSEAEELFRKNLEKRRIGLYVADAESGNIERLVDSDVSDDLDKELKNRALRELGLIE
jgi:hypothetical protein